MYDAYLFDLDGTLVDTESIALRTNMQVFEAMGHPVDEAFLHGLIGKDTATAAGIIRARMPALDMVALDRELRTAFDQGVEAHLPIKPGAVEILGLLPGPVALVTSTGRQGAWHKLRLAGIADAFAEVVTRDDVTLPKPAPEPYLLAAARLGVDPARCLVFEDSEIGAEAAHRAGCRVVQVPDILPTQGRFAHHVAASLFEGARAAGLSV